MFNTVQKKQLDPALQDILIRNWNMQVVVRYLLTDPQ